MRCGDLRIPSYPNSEIARTAIRYQQEASKYVEVAGTGAHRLNEITQRTAEAVGTALAKSGFGLITGGWQGVDYVVAATYLNGGGKSLVHTLTPYSMNRFKEAFEVEAQDEQAAERLADGVVLIGGLGGTLRIFQSARELGKPVFPYGPSGGDAQKCVGILGEQEQGALQTDLSPEEFASYVVHKLGASKQSEHLEHLWELAAQYERIRRTMRAGPERTAAMTAVFEEMLGDAATVTDHLAEFQSSASAGRRLAAIAILHAVPSRDQLEWLADRLDNPSVERPFVGFAAARAFMLRWAHWHRAIAICWSGT